MKHLTSLTIVTAAAVLLFSTAGASAQTARAYVVADAGTGHILDSRGSDEKVQVASLTKVATAMVVLDWLEATRGDVAQIATVPPSAMEIGGVNPVGLTVGARVTLRDLLYSALLQSDNMAAQTLAEHVGRSLPGEGTPLERFVAQMNALARKLGMERTRFLNPHGLETERKPPYSTAADMTRLARYAMADSAFRFYVSQPERKIQVTRPDGTISEYLLRNTNELVGSNAIDGVKTGMTRRAGECLIVSAARDPESRPSGDGVVVTPRRLIVTVLGSQSRFADARVLLARGWQAYDDWAARGRPMERERERR